VTDEAQAIARRRGKWSQKDVPHLGWTCVDKFDAKEDGGDMITCEMCETMDVRFVHVMENERYPEQLHCGCICAAHMSGELKAAQERDKRMRSRAQRRSNFYKRKGWRISPDGSPYIEIDGNQAIIIGSRDDGYHVCARGPHDQKHLSGKKHYASLPEAKKGCFDAIEFLERKQADKAEQFRQALKSPIDILFPSRER
jgi:hypothetical protein